MGRGGVGVEFMWVGVVYVGMGGVGVELVWVWVV